MTLQQDDKQNNILTDIDWNSKNKDFIQIYDTAMDRLIQLVEIDPLAVKIFMFMCKIVNKNNTVIVDIETLGKVLNRDKRQIMRSLKTLREHNFLVIIKHQRNNVYFLNPDIACCTVAPHKRKLLAEYRKLATETDSVDKDIINSEVYDKNHKMTFQISFYKEHSELQPATEHEDYEYMKALETQDQEEQQTTVDEESSPFNLSVEDALKLTDMLQNGGFQADT